MGLQYETVGRGTMAIYTQVYKSISWKMAGLTDLSDCLRVDSGAYFLPHSTDFPFSHWNDSDSRFGFICCGTFFMDM